MTTLVVGATGATGRLLVDRLLARGETVRALVRKSPDSPDLPEELRARDGLTLVQGTVLDLPEAELQGLVRGCDAVASCLGHNLSFGGVFGPPWRLVARSLERLCEVVTTVGAPTRVVLMSSTGVRNPDLSETISLAQHLVLAALRVVIQPHPDNERAARHLCSRIGQDHPVIDWCTVRPDGLVDTDELCDYVLHESPTRSAIFDAGKVARLQVADLMSRLVTDDALWAEWRGRMPVVYDAATG